MVGVGAANMGWLGKWLGVFGDDVPSTKARWPSNANRLNTRGHYHFSDCCRIKHSIIISDSIGIKSVFATLWNTIIVLVSFVSMFVRQ